METTRFTLTEDHLKLSKGMFVEWEGGAYEGAPCIDIKRPYGNGYVMGDIAEMLGWPIDDDGELRPDDLAKAKQLHREMEHALQIILCTQSFVPGEYRRESEYDALSWALVREGGVGKRS